MWGNHISYRCVCIKTARLQSEEMANISTSTTSTAPPSAPRHQHHQHHLLLRHSQSSEWRHVISVTPKIRIKSVHFTGLVLLMQHSMVQVGPILPFDALLLSSLEFGPQFFTSLSHALAHTHTLSLSRSLSLFQAVSTAKLPSAFTHPSLLALLLQLLLSLSFSLALTDNDCKPTL